MNDELLEELLRARRTRTPCALATVAATTGSVPREAGSKMLVYHDGTISGTIGGGKFQALVAEDCLTALRAKETRLKTYPLHEASDRSFGAICGGEVTVLLEPQNLNTAVFLIGGGHCSRAIANLAAECGMHVTVIEQRAELLDGFPAAVQCRADLAPAAFIESRTWQGDDALVLLSHNYELDQQALAAALRVAEIGYIGMIGSRRKVRRVFDALREAGYTEEQLAKVYAPVGLDIGADSPAEIAVSTMAEILQLQRGRSGNHLRSLDSAAGRHDPGALHH
ncbi:MAG: XdhC family protein [Chthoniobacterales bacterium]